MNIKKNSKQLLKLSLEKFFASRHPSAIVDKYKVALRRKLYSKKFNTDDFIQFIYELGVRPGDTVFFQSSWTEFFNYTSSPKELVEAFISFIGSEGTLAMPANSHYDRGKPFDVKRTPTNAGLIAEVFRRMPNVKRSIHYNSSVCAIGRDADEILCSHHKSYTSWDDHSPFAKLIMNNATNLTIGLGYFFTYVTPIHYVDSLLRDEIPYYSKIFTHEFEAKWIDGDGVSGSSRVLERGNGEINLKRYSRYLENVVHTNGKLSNMKCFAVQLEPLIAEAIKLARRGVFLYEKPKPSFSDLTKLDR